MINKISLTFLHYSLYCMRTQGIGIVSFRFSRKSCFIAIFTKMYFFHKQHKFNQQHLRLQHQSQQQHQQQRKAIKQVTQHHGLF